MPEVISRVNGLRINIPIDARGVIHRFAIGGGGNELVFEPIKRSDFDASKAKEKEPVGFGGKPTEEPMETMTVTLTENVIEDDKPKTRKPRAQPDVEL